MPYLAAIDYRSQIKDEIINNVINTDASLRLDMESKAEAQMRSRLAIRYDVTTIFNQTGANRNAEIVMYYIDMVIYHLHSRISGGQIPQTRIDRYNEAMNWLDKVAAGSYLPQNLPQIIDADGDGTSDGNVVQSGSRAARDPYF